MLRETSSSRSRRSGSQSNWKRQTALWDQGSLVLHSSKTRNPSAAIFVPTGKRYGSQALSPPLSIDMQVKSMVSSLALKSSTHRDASREGNKASSLKTTLALAESLEHGMGGTVGAEAAGVCVGVGEEAGVECVGGQELGVPCSGRGSRSGRWRRYWRGSLSGRGRRGRRGSWSRRWRGCWRRRGSWNRRRRWRRRGCWRRVAS